MKFTFKTEKPTGRYRAFDSDDHHIKLNKKRVGSIVDGEWTIRLMVLKSDINEDGNPNCKWKWITLKKKSASLQEAKDWLNENFFAIIEKHRIIYSD
jgi:glutamine synthetase adenylyltransferase